MPKINFRTTWKFLFLTLSVLILGAGCSSKISSTPEFDALKPHVLAILPPNADLNIRKERVDYLQKALAIELSNNGFFVLDQKISDKICSNNSGASPVNNEEVCPIFKTIFETYPVQSLVRLNLTSATKNNFIVGFYNTIEGSLDFFDKSNKKILTIPYSDSQSGGVILQSGQIIQGFQSTFDNYGDDGFNKLAESYIEGIVSKIPAEPTSTLASNDDEQFNSFLAIPENTPEVIEKSNAEYLICTKTSPQYFAFLQIDKTKTSLRETKPGVFCGAFNSENNIGSHSKVSIEVRTPFGVVNRKDLQLSSGNICDLTGKVVIKNLSQGQDGSAQKTEIIVPCLSENNCQNTPCEVNKVAIYRADNPGGSYLKVAESQGSWSTVGGNKNHHYQIVAKSSKGSISLPYEPVIK